MNDATHMAEKKKSETKANLIVRAAVKQYDTGV